MLEDVPATKESWSKPMVHTSLPAFVPRYSVGVNAARLGSNEPISSVTLIMRNWHLILLDTYKR